MTYLLNMDEISRAVVDWLSARLGETARGSVRMKVNFTVDTMAKTITAEVRVDRIEKAKEP